MPGSLEAVDIASVVGGFADLVHQAGAPVTPERSSRLAAAITIARPATVDDLYWLARITLVSSPTEIDVFDRVFRQVFGGVVDFADFRGDSNSSPPPSFKRDASQHGQSPNDRTGPRSPRPAPSLPGQSETNHRDDDDDDAAESILAAMSTDERLRNQDFRPLTPAELTQLRELMSRLALAAPRRQSRRTTRIASAHIDLRASMRRHCAPAVTRST